MHAELVTNDPASVEAVVANAGNLFAIAVASGPATVTNNLVTLTVAGAVRLRTAQSGSALYEAAPDMAQSFKLSNAVLVATSSYATRLYVAPNPPLAAHLRAL